MPFNKVRELHEMNPMLGLRGVRLSIVFPGITGITGVAEAVGDANPEPLRANCDFAA